jgi:hypothetical protein
VRLGDVLAADQARLQALVEPSAQGARCRAVGGEARVGDGQTLEAVAAQYLAVAISHPTRVAAPDANSADRVGEARPVDGGAIALQLGRGLVVGSQKTSNGAPYWICVASLPVEP